MLAMRAIPRSEPISIGEPEKVTSWPWEKVTVRDRRGQEDPKPEEPPKDIPVAQVDHEAVEALARTAFLKEHMSPKGGLGLPPALDEARLHWGIPDEAFDAVALFDRIHVWPIDLRGKEETYMAGGAIIKPETSRMRDLQQGYRGILISAGMGASDRLMSHGTELGDIVHTIKNVPHAHECLSYKKWGFVYLVMREGDLNGNESLRARLRTGVMKIEDCGGDDSYSHQIAGRKKQSVFQSNLDF